MKQIFIIFIFFSSSAVAQDLSDFSRDTIRSIKIACSYSETQGPAAYSQCLSKHVADAKALPEAPSLVGLPQDAIHSIKIACSYSETQGPAAYSQCLSKHVADAKALPEAPSLVGLPQDAIHSIKMVCSYAKTQGPAAYSQCLSKHVTDAKALPEAPSLNGLSQAAIRSIKMVCSYAKTQGPVAYSQCLSKHVADAKDLPIVLNVPDTSISTLGNPAKDNARASYALSPNSTNGSDILPSVETRYKYNQRYGDGRYNYDVSGYTDSGSYVYGDVDTNGKNVDGYIYDENGDAKYFDGEFTGHGQIEGYDENGEYITLDVN